MRKRIWTLPVAAALVAATIAAPAQSTVRERFSLFETYAYTQDCGFPVAVTGARTDHFVLREGKNRDAGAFPVLNRFSYSERWTNPESGAWFQIRGRTTFNETRVTRVDGSIFEFSAVEAGQPFVVEDSEGRVVERNSGTVRISYRFDTLGDDEPGGEWLEDVDFRVAGPHPSLSIHPCTYAAELIG